MCRIVAARIRRLAVEEDGPTATEYAVMLALVLVVIIATLRTYGENLDSTFQNINTEMFGS